MREDIAPLAVHSLEQFTQELGKGHLEMTPEAVYYLEKYDWPGNVRELAHEIKRLVVLTRGPHITPAELSPEIQNASRSIVRMSQQFPKGTLESGARRTGATHDTGSAHRLRIQSGTERAEVRAQPPRPHQETQTLWYRTPPQYTLGKCRLIAPCKTLAYRQALRKRVRGLAFLSHLEGDRHPAGTSCEGDI